jgi:predicted N-formylglutamate amidohydrolase
VIAREGESWRLLGEPKFGGILIVSDHASNRVPEGIDLGIAPDLLDQHIAVDIGVGAIAAIMAQRPGIAAFCAHVSRLVCDLNRGEHQAATIPMSATARHPRQRAGRCGRARRGWRVSTPYHAALADLLDAVPPALILAAQLHPAPCHQRRGPAMAHRHPYNEDDRAARIAIPLLEAEGLPGSPLAVGDQQPYSGRVLNYTMNRHAEAEGRPYLGVEIRQDLIGDAAGQAIWAERLARLCNKVALAIG